MLLERAYRIPSKSFFLFGPRGVGKSTWIKQRGGFDLAIDLLRHSVFLELQRDPSLLEAKTANLKAGATIFIDEIQKLPELLDEVHRLMEDRKLEFILTGSSARKLKRAGANLLGGRAHTYKMFPLTVKELGDLFSVDDLLVHGSLPVVLRDPSLGDETLASYVGTYLREEIKEEALVRRVEEFSRFLTIAGQLNATVLNFENVARDTGKSGKTIQGWYEILQETLLGRYVEPWRPGFKVRESGHPKFYWFDAGVARVASGLAPRDVDNTWKGFAFEGLVFNELQAYLELSRKGFSISYYGTPGAGEIDFVVETRPKTINRPPEFVTIEVKYSRVWKREFEGPSRSLRSIRPESHKRMLGVYMGDEALGFDGFEVYPVRQFVEQLHHGMIF
ncbi:ATPase [Planctomyces bekefii]|uniref:ATPase n=1 Tax=Planctomyces bekefii TaxID=1653850 RepID=A0A5C6M706_9PLAN|nr:ATPase [Planctomyces bekefii]